MSISQIPSGWTITRSDERIVVQHVSGSFYAAAAEGDSGIAESILYMLADSLLSATLSPAHSGDGVDTSAWPACNPACDPEFNGHKSRHCTCAAAKAALSTLPGAVPAELTNVRCMCGDEYPHDSYGAGFIAGSGMCENCDAAIPAKEPPAAGVPEGKLLVSAEPLRKVLNALVGAPHYIRELQATRSPAELFSDNPINVLIAEFNNAQASEQQRAVVMTEGIPAMASFVAFADTLKLNLRDRDDLWDGAMALYRQLAEFLRLNPHLAKGEGV